MKIWKIAFLAVLAGLLFTSGTTNAQNLQRGEVHGFVYDSSHALVPNAKVSISNGATGYKRELSTDASGAYVFAQLIPGTYEVAAEASGFAPITITDVVVEIGSSLNLDITLPVKGQTATVTVTAAATGAIDTSTAGINQVINQRNLEGLPLSGRDYRDLAQLSSSAEVVPGLRGGIRLGGQQSDYSGLVIDGQDNFDNFFGENFGSLETKNFTVPLESVQEFQVVTNGFAPEFGRATGGLINVITKSGTNEWHGEAHEYYRGSSFTSDDFLGFPSNIDNQNQFGGSVGLPIRKDRQFLFVSTDIQRENGPLSSICGIPGCEGNFAETTGPHFANCEVGDASKVGGRVPAGGIVGCVPGEVPLPGNAGTEGFLLPASCGTPAAGDLVLTDCFGGISNLGQLLGSSNQLQNLFTIVGHYDFQFSPANHFSVRANGTRNHTSGFTGGLGQNQVIAGFSETENFVNQGISSTFALNTVLGRKVNEIRFSIQGEVRKRHANGAGQPTINFDAGSDGNAFTFGERYYLPINGDDGKLQAADNFAYSFGKHDVKFGGDVDAFVVRKNMFAGWGTGQFNFADLESFQTGQAYALIEGFSANGQPYFTAGTNFPSYQNAIGLYVQDKWAITPRFTLTYGVRWDGTFNPQPQTPLPGNEVLVGFGGNTRIDPRGVPQRVPNDLKQFGPRVGFAWNVGSADHPTVVRGAWGYYYAQIPMLFMPVAGGGKTTQLFCFFDPTCFPTPGFPYLYNSQFPPASAGGLPSFTYFDPATKNPRISNLTGSVEHSFAHDWTITATFAWVNSARLRTGGYGTEEAWARNFSTDGTDQFGRAILTGPLDPTLGASLDTYGSFSHGNYISGVLNVTKRFSNHFQVFANYIWSQNKDNGSSERDTDTYWGAQDISNLGLDYGRNGLDVRHQFKAAGVYTLPMGFTVSSSLIAHSGVPYPLYINVDVNGDGVVDSLFNNDHPSVMLPNGNEVLVGRYPFSQPSYFEWDARLQKAFPIKDRYQILLQADFFNLTNYANKYSNPNTNATVNYQPFCTPRVGALGFSCDPLNALPQLDRSDPSGYGGINQVAPLSTPFAFQAGVKFVF